MGIPLDEWNGSAEVRRLRESIENFQKSTDSQTRKMIVLTYVIVALTSVMVIEVGLQIYLDWAPT